MTFILIDVFTFRFHSDNYDSDNNGFQLEYSTQNCDDGTNNVCNIGMADNNVDLFQIIFLGKKTE